VFGRAKLSLLVRGEVESNASSSSCQTSSINLRFRWIIVWFALTSLVLYEGVKEAHVKVKFVLCDLFVGQRSFKDELVAVLVLI